MRQSSGHEQLQRLKTQAVNISMNSHSKAPNKPLIEGLGWKIDSGLVADETKIMAFNNHTSSVC